LFLKKTKATELLEAKKFLMVPDIFNYFLTGKISNEYSNATTTLLLDIKKKKWEKTILENIGVPADLFSEITMPGTKIGFVNNKFNEIPVKGKIPVFTSASHDSASAAAGIPVVDKNKNWAFVSLGTWCIIGKETKEPIISDKIFKSAYANWGGAEGRNLFVCGITGLWIIQQCRDYWIRTQLKKISWDDLVEYAKISEPFKAFINIKNPVFSLKQTNMPKIINEYIQKKNQKPPENMGEIVRCVYESLALSLRYYIDLMERLTQEKIEIIQLVGGGSKNKLLCQWISNATEKLVASGPSETTSIGNLLMQLKGTKEINSLEEGRKIAFDSARVIFYEPEETNKWKEIYYSRFKKLLESEENK
jgi:sugar (pentulose or hexulose) kinase